ETSGAGVLEPETGALIGAAAARAVKRPLELVARLELGLLLGAGLGRVDGLVAEGLLRLLGGGDVGLGRGGFLAASAAGGQPGDGGERDGEAESSHGWSPCHKT